MTTPSPKLTQRLWFRITAALSAAAILACGVVLWRLDGLARNACIRTAEQEFGVRLVLGAANFSPWSGRLAMRDITVHNPPTFNRGVLLAVSELSADLAVWDSIRHRRLHMRTLSVKVAEADYEVLEHGATNLDRLLAPRPNSSARFPVIDRLSVSMGTVHVQNESLQPPVRFSLALAIHDRSAFGVDTPAKLQAFIAQEICPAIRNEAAEQQKQTPNSGLLDFLPR